MLYTEHGRQEKRRKGHQKRPDAPQYKTDVTRAAAHDLRFSNVTPFQLAHCLTHVAPRLTTLVLLAVGESMGRSNPIRIPLALLDPQRAFPN